MVYQHLLEATCRCYYTRFQFLGLGGVTRASRQSHRISFYNLSPDQKALHIYPDRQDISLLAVLNGQLYPYKETIAITL